MPCGVDGRIHTTFGHNPSSLRLSSFDPNLQNIPRGGKKGYERYVKEIFVAPEGFLFWERDFSAIEAVLVGYFAGSPDYIRFAKLGVHDFLASHMLKRPADLSWSADTLRAYFKEIKTNHKEVRDNAKRVIHGSNYMMSARRMHELFPESFPDVKTAASLQELYFDLFPAIRRWHRELAVRVDGTKRRGKDDDPGMGVDPWTLGVCYARNPFGYVHHFYNVLNWQRIEIADGSVEWISEFGEDAKRLVSFLPQSTAAAIIKQAAKRLFYDFPWVGQTLRLLIHDSILGEAQESDVERCLEISAQVMEAPIPELPLDPTWGLGEYLTIGTEAKVGKSWGAME
jgi:DNA polymerase I-like protein with 3'-5' exonuclease and polymerase domains